MDNSYAFDYAAFYADPEGYEFTEEDNRYFNAIELERYEQTVPMTPAEKRALRKWVAAGNSVSENPGSRYVCSDGCYPPMDFLAVYRLDKELDKALKGKSKTEKEHYLKDYFGYESPEEKLQQAEDQFVSPTTFGCLSLPRDSGRKLTNFLRTIWTSQCCLSQTGKASFSDRPAVF